MHKQYAQQYTNVGEYNCVVLRADDTDILITLLYQARLKKRIQHLLEKWGILVTMQLGKFYNATRSFKGKGKARPFAIMKNCTSHSSIK